KFIKVYAGERKVYSWKVDLFKIKQCNFKLLGDFIIRFQKERLKLPTVPDDWAVEAFTNGLNLDSSVSSLRRKESLTVFKATTWVNIHNQYDSKIRIKDNNRWSPNTSKG
ncbi:hypothetical protein HAX54_029126, partial [Datura stramonium]|nr:hypothetical protein [Datura stramonium]